MIHKLPQSSSGTAPVEILHPGSRTLFRHWEMVRGEDSAPVRSELKLHQLHTILPWLCVLERHPLKQSYSWRLAGSGICRLLGTDPTGTRALAGWPQFERETVVRGLDGVVGALQPCVARIKAVSGHGEAIGFEFLALPVQADGTNTIQVAGCFMPFGEPEWFGREVLTGFELSSLRMIWTEPVPGAKISALRPVNHAPSGRPAGPFVLINGGLSDN